MTSAVRLIALFFTSLALFSGCFAVRPFTGAPVDQEQLRKAREAKVLDIRYAGAEELSRRLLRPDPIENADLTLYLSESLLNKTAAQLDSTTGWLDSLTSYTIRSIRIKLYNGSAIATVSMAAFNHQYDVDVDLVMDCLLTFSIDSTTVSGNVLQGKFNARLEPFNIVPTVHATGLMSSVDDIIRDILAIKIATINDYLPPIQFPVDFTNEFPVEENHIAVRSGIIMDITTPRHRLQYSLAVKEVLIFTGRVFLALNVRGAGVGK